MSETRRVLVTGATGFVGANLVRRLVADGHDVHIVHRMGSNAWRIADIMPNITAHVVDINDSARLLAAATAARPDVIFHLATAGLYGGASIADRDLMQANVIGTVNMLAACQQLDYQSFVVTGSAGEYGRKQQPMREDDACEPDTVYGISKLASTLYGSYLATTTKKPIVCARLFTPYGPFNDPSRLVTYATIRALRGLDLALADPRTMRDFTYVEDVVDFYLACMDAASGQAGEIFNVGTGIQTSTGDVVEQILELTGSKSAARWNAFTAPAHGSPRWEADMTKTFSRFDWRPRHDLAAGLEKTVAWFSEHLDLYPNV